MSRLICPVCHFLLGFHAEGCPEAPDVDDHGPADDSWKARQDQAEEERKDDEREAR